MYFKETESLWIVLHRSDRVNYFCSHICSRFHQLYWTGQKVHLGSCSILWEKQGGCDRPHRRSGVATGSARLRLRRSGQKELSQVRGQGQQLKGATPHPRSEAAAKRSNPVSKEQQLHGHRRAERSYPTFKVRRGNSYKLRTSGWALLEQPWRYIPCPR